MGNIKTN